MKTSIIKILSIVLVGAVAFNACTKKIDLEPEFQLDGSKPLATIEEAENVLTGAYAGFLRDGYYDANGPITGGSFSEFPDMMSDNLVESAESLGNYKVVAEWTYVSNTNYIDNTWLNTYKIISAVNIILRDIDALSAEDAGAANRIKGQALAIRAFVHFDLLRYYGTTFDRNATELGVPYVKNYDPTAKPARNTTKEVYDNVYADLNAAATAFASMDDEINSASKHSRIDLPAVNAILARVNLYSGQWAAAVASATAAINARPLSTIDEFPGIWTDDEVGEVFWAAAFETLTDGVPYDNVFFVRRNRSSYKPASQLIALFDQANDVRFDSYIATIGNFNGSNQSPRPVVVKHIGRSSNTLNGVVDWKVLRTAEMYLIRAEANYKLNNGAAALADLNTLRQNRIVGFTAGAETGAALLDAILLERRKELAFEGHRFFDLKRLNRTPIDRCPSNAGSPSTICQLPSSSRSWAWPIPFNETNTNPNIVQNPGY